MWDTTTFSICTRLLKSLIVSWIYHVLVLRAAGNVFVLVPPPPWIGTRRPALARCHLCCKLLHSLTAVFTVSPPMMLCASDLSARTHCQVCSFLVFSDLRESFISSWIVVGWTGGGRPPKMLHRWENVSDMGVCVNHLSQWEILKTPVLYINTFLCFLPFILCLHCSRL